MFLDDLFKILDLNENTLLVGDLNICLLSHGYHPILKALSQLMFRHNVRQSTHQDGHVIDYASHYCPSNTIENLEVQQYGQYFTDHDMLIVNVDAFLNQHS